MFFENPSGHGRPRRKSWTSAPKSAFSCGPGVMGRNFFDPWSSGHKGQECPQEIRTKSLCLCCFSSLNPQRRIRCAPPTPRVAAVKELYLVHNGRCRGFFVKFVVAIYPGNGRTNICNNVCQIFAAFSSVSCQIFARVSLWGIAGHNIQWGPDCELLQQQPHENVDV